MQSPNRTSSALLGNCKALDSTMSKVEGFASSSETTITYYDHNRAFRAIGIKALTKASKQKSARGEGRNRPNRKQKPADYKPSRQWAIEKKAGRRVRKIVLARVKTLHIHETNKRRRFKTQEAKPYFISGVIWCRRTSNRTKTWPPRKGIDSPFREDKKHQLQVGSCKYQTWQPTFWDQLRVLQYLSRCFDQI